MISDEDWLAEGHADRNSAGCYAVAIEALRERLERSRVVIGNCTLYNEDCAFVLPHTGPVDALVTDPPYGIGEARKNPASRDKLTSKGVAVPIRAWEPSDWDDEPVTPDLIDAVLRRGRWKIVFGGNYYAMPPSSCWLVWDKLNTGAFADCELAWTNLDKAVRIIRFRWNGMLRQNNEPRGDHPTQKPVGVMTWCIGQLPSEAKVILDPFMGSGTTGVACVKMGRKFVGIEREKRYFDAACRRIEEAYRQGALEFPPPPPPRYEQMDMID
ncbi:MAG: site-specific DNA-methyltransferase [Pseudomonadota bacterium]|nr:site-specific DNA-methyltransferase [Pseudomonadota bacterium]